MARMLSDLLVPVELVRLYSNHRAELETLLVPLVKATSAPRPRERRPAPRQTQVRLNPDHVKTLTAAYSEGKTIKELATRFAIHRTTVKAILERSGVRPHQARFNRRTDASPGGRRASAVDANGHPHDPARLIMSRYH